MQLGVEYPNFAPHLAFDSSGGEIKVFKVVFSAGALKKKIIYNSVEF